MAAAAEGACAAWLPWGGGGGCGEPAPEQRSWSAVQAVALPLLLAIVAAELLFLLLLRLRTARWRRPLDWHAGDFPPPPRRPEETLRKIERFLCKSRRQAEDFFSGWYFDTDVSRLARVDAEELIAWAVFARRRSELSEEERGLGSAMLQRVEAEVGLEWGVTAEESEHRISRPRFAAHTWEKECKYQFFPLLFYTFIFVVHRLIDFPVLTLLGFRRGRRGDIGYWIKSGGMKEEQEPLDAYVFLHGISVGRVFYLPFVLGFCHRPVVIIDMPWVAFNPFQCTVPRAEDFCAGVAEVFDAHGLSSVCVMAHSYGSFVASWLLACPRLRDRVARVAFISAPALLLFHPKTCRAVVYDQPFWFEHSLAHVFFRQFFWYEYMLTAEDLPRGSVVVLSERDEMIPVPQVASDCKEHGIGHLVLPRQRHGFELFIPFSCRRIIKYILAQEKEPQPKEQCSLRAALWSSAGSCF